MGLGSENCRNRDVLNGKVKCSTKYKYICGLCSVMRENGPGPIHRWIFCNQIRRDLHFIRQIVGLEMVPRTFIILSVTRSSRSDPCSSWLIVVSPVLR